MIALMSEIIDTTPKHAISKKTYLEIYEIYVVTLFTSIKRHTKTERYKTIEQILEYTFQISNKGFFSQSNNHNHPKFFEILSEI